MTRRSKKPRFELTLPSGAVDYSTEDVCRAHLEGAIELYAYHRNPVAAYLLANAAHDVMRGYAKNRKMPLRVDVVARISQRYGDDAKEMIDALKAPYNSVKHSNLTEGTPAVTLHHVLVEFTLLQACQEFGSIFGFGPLKMLVFVGWVVSARKDDIKMKTKIEKSMYSEGIATKSMEEQLLELQERLDEVADDPNMFGPERDALSTADVWPETSF